MSYIHLSDSEDLRIQLERHRRKAQRFYWARRGLIAVLTLGVLAIPLGIALGILGVVGTDDAIGIAVVPFLFFAMPGTSGLFFLHSWEDDQGILEDLARAEARYNAALLREAGLV